MKTAVAVASKPTCTFPHVAAAEYLPIVISVPGGAWVRRPGRDRQYDRQSQMAGAVLLYRVARWSGIVGLEETMLEFDAGKTTSMQAV